jgi:serine/threonine protein kinase
MIVGTININGVNINIYENDKLGEGSFADVYKVGETDFVCKLYKNTDQLPFRFLIYISENILEFATTFPKMLDLTSFYDTQLYNVGNRSGFIMKKMNGSLDKLIEENNIDMFLKNVDSAVNHLMTMQKNNDKYGFVHGDIKIENILYNEKQVVLHDFDGVFTYDKSTLFHIDKNQIPYKRNVYMTPLCAHPVYVKYTDAIKTNGELMTNIKKDGFINIWTKYVTLTGSSLATEISNHVIALLDHFYEHGFENFMQNIDEVFTNSKPEENVFGVIFELGTGLPSTIREFRKKYNKGTLIWDMRLAYQLTKDVKTSFIVKNMLNTVYAERPAIISPPRTYTLQLAVDL